MVKMFIASFICLITMAAMSGDESRSRVLLIDSGVNKAGIENFLCKDGHTSFLKGAHKEALVDPTGHGTMMAKTIVQHLNPAEHCIVVFKSYPGYPDAEAYATALHEAMNGVYVSVVIALEDVGHYHAEAEWFKKLTKKTRVFVAAGNGGKDLSKKCDVFPACLATKVNSKNFRVVAAPNVNLNHGGPVNEIENSEVVIDGMKHNGTSVSTARAAAKYASLK